MSLFPKAFLCQDCQWCLNTAEVGSFQDFVIELICLLLTAEEYEQSVIEVISVNIIKVRKYMEDAAAAQLWEIWPDIIQMNRDKCKQNACNIRPLTAISIVAGPDIKGSPSWKTWFSLVFWNKEFSVICRHEGCAITTAQPIDVSDSKVTLIQCWVFTQTTILVKIDISVFKVYAIISLWNGSRC